jgi:hypothetical protein
MRLFFYNFFSLYKVSMKAERKINLSLLETQYSLKLQQAKLEENYDKIQILLWELKTLRKFYKKKL